MLVLPTFLHDAKCSRARTPDTRTISTEAMTRVWTAALVCAVGCAVTSAAQVKPPNPAPPAPATAAPAKPPAAAPAPIVLKSGKPVAVPPRCLREIVAEMGVPCSADDPCPTYLELSDIQSVGNRVLIAGNIHTGQSTMESVLLVSDDAGITWTEPHTRLPFTVLDKIQFHGFENGWISGHILQPLPKDPFLLLTKDGGKSWRKAPLSGEGRTGAIAAFYFDSPQHGLLSLERSASSGDRLRHELWESMTGGTSWSVKQVDAKPIEVRIPASAATWRLRPDSAAKAQRVEVNEGGSWRTVGSFSVEAGECKLADPAPADPALIAR